MSIAVVGYAFGLALPSTEKWLLVCLADYADEWGDSIFPTLDTLADKSGMSPDTIKRALRRLVERGVLERIAESTPVSPAFYRILGVPEPTTFAKEKEPTCPASLRRAVIYLFAARCEYCRQEGTKDMGPDGKPWTIDRVVPGRRGGAYAPDNVTLACRFCTTKKRGQEGTRTLAALQRETLQNAPSPGEAEGVQGAPLGGGNLPGREGGTVHPDPLSDPGSDPSADKAGAKRPDRPDRRAADENPDDNIGVLTKLAHEAYDVLGTHAEPIDLAEALKWRCARLRIAYRSDLVAKALDSAKWQRGHLPGGAAR